MDIHKLRCVDKQGGEGFAKNVNDTIQAYVLNLSTKGSFRERSLLMHPENIFRVRAWKISNLKYNISKITYPQIHYTGSGGCAYFGKHLKMTFNIFDKLLGYHK